MRIRRYKNEKNIHEMPVPKKKQKITKGSIKQVLPGPLRCHLQQCSKIYVLYNVIVLLRSQKLHLTTYGIASKQ